MCDIATDEATPYLYMVATSLTPHACIHTQKLHLEMLNDRPRTLAYRTAIETARPFIEDKVMKA